MKICNNITARIRIKGTGSGATRRCLSPFILEQTLPKQSDTIHKKPNRGRRHKSLKRIESHLDGLEDMLKNFGQREKPVTKSDNPKLDAVIGRQVQRMLDLREEPHKQYWNAELDANAGLGAQYIMMMHFLGRVDLEKQRLYANYTREWQTEQGFWTIHKGGPGHLSYTVTCYFALKLAGDDVDAPHMKTAREWILNNGGAMQIGVEARLQFAMFGLYDWAGVPPIPPWLVLLPHLPMLPKILEQKSISIYDLSYWCRISLIPMSVIYDKKPMRRVEVDGAVIDIEELFIESPDERVWDFKTYSEPGIISWGMLIQLGTRSVKKLERLISPLVRKIALRKAKDWILSHQDDSGDWGGIYPPVMYNIIALELLGLDPEDDRLKRAWEALDRFSIYHKEVDGLHMQACVSPVWDTAWSVFALAEAGVDIGSKEMQGHIDWLYSQQIFREGDWSVKNPKAVPGAWCFQFYNDFYPDIDDTAIVLMALLSGGGFSHTDSSRAEQVRLGFEWLIAMQNTDGGWSAFENGVNKDCQRIEINTQTQKPFFETLQPLWTYIQWRK
ncbi:MAG: hypothetical protein L3J82_08590 [Planctomycetes bacterium]|nr:hypothetical protein [Planctomycetota bacterium]